MAPQPQSNSRILYLIAFLLLILIAQLAWTSIENATNISLRGDTTSTSSSSASSSSSSTIETTGLIGSPSGESSKTFQDLPHFATTSYLHKKSPPNMPSVRLTPEEEKLLNKNREIYGGKMDKPHLGTVVIFFSV
jgi:hypothetical protein